jgi:hypothetical protein
MAKVINQDIPASEVLYDPDPARPYTLGEAYVNIMTEGHHSPVTEGELIVQKTPRQGRPPQRGPGSTAQAPQRACFLCCAQMWRDSPTYYKNCVKDVYNSGRPPVKDRQIPPEWYSTPYSTFMKECLKKCRSVGSCAFDPYSIFICPDPECINTTIGYTTTNMGTGETQQFTIVNGQEGATNIFTITSGGGTITPAGFYTAPATNPNCNENPIIQLTCNGKPADTLEIAINGWANACDRAYIVYEYHDMSANPPDGMCCSGAYNCAGERIIVADCPGHFSSVYCQETYPTYENWDEWPQGGGCENSSFSPAYDARTLDMKNGGCCPVELF